MRSLLAGTIGLSLGLGGALGQEPSASLGRPVPAAVLGRPSAIAAIAPGEPLAPASYRPAYAPPPADTAPLLAPINGPPAEPAPPPRPLPAEGGSRAVMPPAAPLGAGSPSYGPVGGYPPAAVGMIQPGCDACAPGMGCYDAEGAPFTGFGQAYAANAGRLYGSADFLLLFVPTITTRLPIALRSAPPVGGGIPAGATIAIGNNDLISSTRAGARFGGGIWLDPCARRALDGNFFFAGPTSRDFVALTDAANVLLRPYIVINGPVAPPPVAGIPGRPNFADVVPDPGSIRVRTESFLMGGDLNWRRRLMDQCGTTLDVLAGFRYMHLDESLQITESATIAGFGQATLFDRFRTINNFYGFQVGMIATKSWGRWSADMLLKVASGTTSSVVEVQGGNNFDPARPGFGLFVQDSNSGRWRSNNFSVVPEVGLNLGFQVRPRMRINVGYTGLVWSNVLRPGEQIDPIVDQTKVPLLPGVVAPVFNPLPAVDPHPVLTFPRSTYFAHGLNVGVTFKW